MNEITVPNLDLVKVFFATWFGAESIPCGESVLLQIFPYAIKLRQGEVPSTTQTIITNIGFIGAEDKLQSMYESAGLIYIDTKDSGPIAQTVKFQTPFGFNLDVVVVFT